MTVCSHHCGASMAYRRKLAAGALRHLPAQTLLVLVGTSGSGKSSFAALLNLPTISTDTIRRELGITPGTFEREADAIAEFHRRLQGTLDLGFSVVADATHSQARYRLPLLNLRAKARVLVVLQAPLAFCLNSNRLREGSLRCPEETVRRQHGEIEDAIPYLIREGWDSAIFA